MKVSVAQYHFTFYNSMVCSPPGSSVHGILQARIQEWVVIPFSRGSSQPMDQTHISCISSRSFTIWATRDALIVTKRVENALLGCSLKNDRMISVHFQGKPFNIVVIQVYAPTTEVKETEIDWLYEGLPEKATAPHSSTLAWKIPWTEEPGRLQSMRSLRVRHDWATSLSLFTFMHWRRNWQPTPVFLPGESQGRGSLVGCHLWGRTESDMTEAT